MKIMNIFIVGIWIVCFIILGYLMVFLFADVPREDCLENVKTNITGCDMILCRYQGCNVGLINYKKTLKYGFQKEKYCDLVEDRFALSDDIRDKYRIVVSNITQSDCVKMTSIVNKCICKEVV